jgi:hypothetical protein
MSIRKCLLHNTNIHNIHKRGFQAAWFTKATNPVQSSRNNFLTWSPLGGLSEGQGRRDGIRVKITSTGEKGGRESKTGLLVDSSGQVWIRRTSRELNGKNQVHCQKLWGFAPEGGRGRGQLEQVMPGAGGELSCLHIHSYEGIKPSKSAVRRLRHAAQNLRCKHNCKCDNF